LKIKKTRSHIENTNNKKVKYDMWKAANITRNEFPNAFAWDERVSILAIQLEAFVLGKLEYHLL